MNTALEHTSEKHWKNTQKNSEQFYSRKTIESIRKPKEEKLWKHAIEHNNVGDGGGGRGRTGPFL